MKPSKRKPEIDYWGTILVICAVVALLLPLNWGGITYEWDSPIIISLFVVFGVLTAAFIVLEAYFVQMPIIPLHLFKSRNFTLGCV